jgi:hypothetical protein
MQRHMDEDGEDSEDDSGHMGAETTGKDGKMMSEQEKTGSGAFFQCSRHMHGTRTIYRRECGPVALRRAVARTNTSAMSKRRENAWPMLIPQ